MTEKFPEKDLIEMGFQQVQSVIHDSNNIGYDIFLLKCKNRIEIGIIKRWIGGDKKTYIHGYVEVIFCECPKIDSIEKLKQLIELIG